MQIINPATEEILEYITADNEQNLVFKHQLLCSGQPTWAALSLEKRLYILDQFHALLGQHKERLSTILTSETGKPLQQSRNEIAGAQTRIRWMIDNAPLYLKEEQMTNTGNTKETISYEPLGVICNISAWNYPYLVGVNVIVPALIAGNAVVYKPSEYATLTGIAITELLREAGVPDIVFQVAIGDRATGELLLDMPFNAYFFTGSYTTGRHIYARVAPKMVPCQLELGGKDPLYVANDIADIAAVAAATADGAFYNNGQSCCAVERIYVHQDIYNEYVEAFIREVSSWKQGDPTEDGVYLGAITRPEQLAVLERQVQDALQKGAKLLCGGNRKDQKGYFFQPTVLVNVSHDMLVMREESFGPIIGIMKVPDDETALRLMKDTDYGLTASVYCSSPTRAEQLLRGLNVGTAYWNCCDRVSPAVPWSGRGHSGFGATLSHQGMRAFCKPKAWHLRQV